MLFKVNQFNEFPERILLPQACEGRSQKAFPFIVTFDIISLIKGEIWYINEVR